MHLVSQRLGRPRHGLPFRPKRRRHGQRRFGLVPPPPLHGVGHGGRRLGPPQSDPPAEREARSGAREAHGGGEAVGVAGEGAEEGGFGLRRCREMVLSLDGSNRSYPVLRRVWEVAPSLERGNEFYLVLSWV